MPKLYLCIVALCTLLMISGCRKNHHANKAINTTTVKKTDSLSVKKIIKPKPKEATPKVIVVNDSVARKSVDGRLYYDLLGHRYWKNYRDGKYYLFNQAMYSNTDFKPK